MQNDTHSLHSVNRIKTQIMDLSQVMYGINQFDLKTSSAEQDQEISPHTDHMDHGDNHIDLK